MSIADCANASGNVKESIDSIKQRIRRKRSDALELFKKNEDDSEEREMASNLNKEVSVGDELVRGFKLINNQTEDSSHIKVKKRGGVSSKVLYKDDAVVADSYMPVARRILSTRSV